MRKVILGVAIALMALCGCTAPRVSSTQVLAGGKPVFLLGTWLKGADTTLPRPVTSKYFKTYRGGFRLTAEGAYYLLHADVIRDREKPLYVVVEFENPLDPQHPTRYDGPLGPKDRSINPSHGPVHGLRIYESYWVKATLYESKDSATPIDVFTQNIRSLVDTRGEQPVVYGGLKEKE
jgi:hypothetical protein